MHGRQLIAERFGRMRPGAAKARPRSSKALAIALAVGGLVLLFTCNPFVKKPSVPVVTGPDVGVVGIPLTFKATSTDPNGDSVAFMFDWGDTTTKVWTDFVLSGETLSVSHAYAESSDYTVKARAKDPNGVESDWSDGVAVAVLGQGPGYPDTLLYDIPTPRNAYQSVITPDGQYLYVLHYDDGLLTPIRLLDSYVLPSISLGRHPSIQDRMAISPSGEFIYVGCSDRECLVVVRTADNALVDSIALGVAIFGLAMSQDGLRLYAVTSSRGVLVVRTSDNAVVDSLMTGGHPYGVALSPDGQSAFVTLWVENQVAAVRLADGSVSARIGVGSFPKSVAVTPDGSRLMVGTQGDTGFSVIDPVAESVVNVIKLGSVSYDGIGFTTDGAYFLATNYLGLSYVDLRTLERVGLLEYPGGGGGLAVDSYDGRIYVPANRRVHVIGRKG